MAEQWKAEQLKETNKHRIEIEEQNADYQPNHGVHTDDQKSREKGDSQRKTGDG